MTYSDNNHQIYASDFLDGLSPEAYVEIKEQVEILVGELNRLSEKYYKSLEQIEKLISNYSADDSLGNINGRTTLRYEHGKIHGGKYRE